MSIDYQASLKMELPLKCRLLIQRALRRVDKQVVNLLIQRAVTALIPRKVERTAEGGDDSGAIGVYVADDAAGADGLAVVEIGSVGIQ